ncbi:MAG: heavy metal translocating P-type ATPase [Spirochaetes bacterium]|nr:heavy metal translocating P-type ATPase [Spirochaetota bacterium]
MNKFKLENLDCPKCAYKLEESLKKLKFVKSVSIDFATLSILIDTSDIKKVQKEIDKIEPGVKIIISKKEENEIYESFNPKKELTFISIIFVFYLLGLIFNKQMETIPYHIPEYILFLTIYILSGWKVILKAVKNLFKGGIFNENFLMTIATLGAIAIHELPEASGVMLFYKVGEFLQDLSVNRSRKLIKSLLEIKPNYANLVTSNEVKKVSPEEVKIGDKVIVKPGEKIPLDGIVVSGNTQVDTSALTGESKQKVIKERDTVLAGMINKSGLITMEVTKPFNESSINKILELVENAIHKKAKTERFFTKFAKYYTPIIVIIALLTAILPPLLIPDQSFIKWIYRSLVILVISCPCALVVSIPLAYFSGIGGASKKGILIKGSNYLDALNSVKTIVFDKTGTITKGVFKVTDIVPYNGYTKEQLLEISAEAEFSSNHPIALSIKESYGKEIDINIIQEFHEIGGQGIKAKINNKIVLIGNDHLMHEYNIDHDTCHISGTIAHVAIDNKYAGYIIISDEIKNDSIEAVNKLKSLGIKNLIMLTGDNKDIADEVSRKIGIKEYYAELLPENKVSILEKLMNQKDKKDKIIFVGDGINDAPVLARADIGISMGNLGSDAAIETSDIVIMDDSLTKISEAIKIAKKTKIILIQNIIFALGIKVLFIFLGFIGIATMWEAVFGDMGVAIIAIFNSTRALKD